MLEIIITIVLLLILEPIGALIAEKLGDKWKPFEKHYNESLSKNDKAFSMVREPNSTGVLWILIGLFAFSWIIGIVMAIVLTSTKQASVTDGIIIIVSFTALCFPFISMFLHSVTYKIFVTEEQLFIKSLFIKKKYDLKDIINVTEHSKKVSPLVTNYTLEITFKDKKVKIPNFYSNYDLLKNSLLNK